ncbi:hypothetical protein FB45DRAFT_893158 [Roridomyces roridus]|uniref:Inhibitor I9 domain-containing protein n=1 Tax=Roridomyces roridus TaxID=1738132 RepID=A0AAD7CF77_9AGAR|nr:hypothetical protein FB45DRAFT_893158 [Roridomyces roridus]
MSEQNYIVTFKSTALQDEIDKFVDNVANDGGEIGHRFKISKGFSAKLSQKNFDSLNSLQADPDSIVESIEADGVVTTQ